MTSNLPLDALRVFSTVARLLSFTRAGVELNLTQSAVSHRIKALEESLGVALFSRSTRSLSLTAEGRKLAQGIDQAMTRIGTVLADVSGRACSTTITITTLPSFALRWMMPRLKRLSEQLPTIDLQIDTDDRPLDLRGADIDFAIRFGHGVYPGLSVTWLMADHVIPVCAPPLLEGRAPIESVDDLMQFPLIHDVATEGDGSGSDWGSWLRFFDRGDMELPRNARFCQANLTIEAAAQGLGVALARKTLIGDAIKSGRLVAPLPWAAPTVFNYYLLSTPETALDPNKKKFRDWIIAEAAAGEAEQRPIH